MLRRDGGFIGQRMLNREGTATEKPLWMIFTVAEEGFISAFRGQTDLEYLIIHYV